MRCFELGGREHQTRVSFPELLRRADQRVHMWGPLFLGEIHTILAMFLVLAHEFLGL